MQAHFIPGGTRFAQLCQDTCFLHDANTFGQQGMGHSPRTPTLRKVRAVFTEREREPTGRVIIVIVIEREEKREEGEERGREREENPLSPPPPSTLPPARVLVQNVSVFTFETPRCVPAKRLCELKEAKEKGAGLLRLEHRVPDREQSPSATCIVGRTLEKPSGRDGRATKAHRRKSGTSSIFQGGWL